MSDGQRPDRARQVDPIVSVTVVPVPRIDGALPTRTVIVSPAPLTPRATPRHRA